MSITKEQQAFLDIWYEMTANVVRHHNLPVSAMLSCAAIESAWGTGNIFTHTANPFSLQKWPVTPIPYCYKIHWQSTVVNTETGEKKFSPFCCATSREDAVRQWCEWILFYGSAGAAPGDPKRVLTRDKPQAVNRRAQLLAHRNDGAEFAFRLPLVGFGQNRTEAQRIKHGTGYANVVRDYTKKYR